MAVDAYLAQQLALEFNEDLNPSVQVAHSSQGTVQGQDINNYQS